MVFKIFLFKKRLHIPIGKDNILQHYFGSF